MKQIIINGCRYNPDNIITWIVSRARHLNPTPTEESRRKSREREADKRLKERAEQEIEKKGRNNLPFFPTI